MRIKKRVLTRRIGQVALNLLYAAPLYLGWTFVQGNLSASEWFHAVNLVDPLLALQSFLARHSLSVTVVVGTLLILGFFSLMGGRTYCSWVCPVHFILEMADYLRNLTQKLRIRQLTFLLSVKYRALAGVLLASVITGLTAFEVVSPIGITARAIAHGPEIGLALVASILLFEVFFSKRAWCRSLCPLGAFYALVGRHSPFRVRMDNARCTQCMACKVNCIAKEVLDPPILHGKAAVESGECTRCGHCIDDCGPGALGFGFQMPTFSRGQKSRTGAKAKE